MSCSDSDMALVGRLIRREEAAWAELLERYSRLIYKHIYNCFHHSRMPSLKHDTEDLYYSVLDALLENDCHKLRQFQGGCSLASWLRTVTRSTVVDHIRRSRSQFSLDDKNQQGSTIEKNLVDPGPTAEEEVMRLQMVEIVRQVLEELPAEDQLLMEMAFGRQRPGDEIAIVLGISVEAVYTRKNRLLKKIQKALEDRGIL